VAAYALRIAIRAVTIEREQGNGTNGCTTTAGLGASWEADALDERMRRRVEAHIMGFCAGIAAEARLTGRRNWRGAEGDHEKAGELALAVSGSAEEAEAYVRWLALRTEALLAAPMYWLAVEAVAAALLERRRLSGPEARGLIRRTIAAKTDELRQRSQAMVGASVVANGPCQ
jgi:hypothetical protein